MTSVRGVIAVVALAGAAAIFALQPVQLSTAEDHKRTMSLLGIESLRRGADGRNADTPNAANYDESKSNPFPELPDPLRLKDGRKVTSPATWWKYRRAEIVED